MFRMRDEKGADDKVLCVPATDPRMEHLRDIHHVPEFQRLEIQHFFEVYKAIEPGKEVRTEAWADRRAAEAEIEACRKRFADAEEHGEPGGVAAEHGDAADHAE
jgi:inorganic pyrophosphatase